MLAPSLTSRSAVGSCPRPVVAHARSGCSAPRPTLVSKLTPGQPLSWQRNVPIGSARQNHPRQNHVAHEQPEQPSWVPQASASAAAPADAPKPASWKIPVYIFLWYAFNIIFNILNKSCLNAFPCPWFIATWQLLVSSLWMCMLWACRFQAVPQLSWPFFLALLPVALFHTVGHVSACVSFSYVAVSFTHIIKSAEPVFAVLLSYPLLGVAYPLYVWLSLVPIVAGVSLSAVKEVSFSWPGFNNAMISNLGMVLRNILSKKALNKYKNIDGINLFGLLSIVSLIYCIPMSVVVEGHMWKAAGEAATAKLGEFAFYQLMLGAGIFYHLYNQASYMVLNQGISPVTFSVGNTMKRVAVVVSAVMFFRNPVGVLNWVGSGVAIFGTYLYSLAMDKHSAEQKAAKAKAA